MAYRRTNKTQKKSLFHTLKLRPYMVYNGFGTTDTMCTVVKDSRRFVEQLNLQKKLPVHEGCVNTICWNKSGQYILSGSDDYNLCITNPHYYDPSPKYTCMSKIISGHRSNIFSAQFMPNSFDRQIASCAQDGAVIALDIDSYEMKGISRFTCHNRTACEIATLPDMSDVFMSCSEDKTVRLFDLRETKNCIAEDCRQNILIKNSHAMTTLSVNPRNPRQFLVGRADGIGLVYDQRMLSTSSAFTPSSPSELETDSATFRHPLHGVVSRFLVPKFDQNYRFTSLSYSPNGQQVLASYSSEYVYLFDIDRSSLVDPEKCTRLSKQANSSDGDNVTSERQSSRAGHRVIPLLRVPGDWSDTGPSSRPGAVFQVGGLMQRLASTLLESTNRLNQARSQDQTATRNLDQADSHSPSESQERDAAQSDASQRDGSPESQGQNARSERISMFISADALRSSRSLFIGQQDEENATGDEDEDTMDDENSDEDDLTGDNSFDDNSNDLLDNSNRDTNEGSIDESNNINPRKQISKETKEKFMKLLDPLKEATKKIKTYAPRQNYTGHRNTRTSIKKATFWGDDYVLSGSDCGHIFMWEKDSGKLAMLFLGDERVVNCLAPNPYDFVLATSGIAYDIKLWTTQNELETPLKCPEEKINSIITRNETMLKEARNTVTLPRHLFIRLLNSLVQT